MPASRAPASSSTTSQPRTEILEAAGHYAHNAYHQKHGCTTHPRTIAERERRARNSKRLRMLQDLVPNMDKQTTTSDKDLDYLIISVGEWWIEQGGRTLKVFY